MEDLRESRKVDLLDEKKAGKTAQNLAATMGLMKVVKKGSS